MHITQIAQR